MLTRTRLFSYALASVLSAASVGATLAQDTQVGSQAVRQDDMIVVQIHCNDLLKSDSEGTGEEISPGVIASGGSRGPEAGEVGGDPAGNPQAPPTDSGTGGAGGTLGQDDAQSVELAAITLDDCRAAGLIN